MGSCITHIKNVLKSYKINNKNVSRIYKRDINNIIDGLKEIEEDFPKLQQDIHSNAAKLRSLNDNKKLNYDILEGVFPF